MSRLNLSPHTHTYETRQQSHLAEAVILPQEDRLYVASSKKCVKSRSDEAEEVILAQKDEGKKTSQTICRRIKYVRKVKLCALKARSGRTKVRSQTGDCRKSATPWFVRGTGALLVASASGPSLDALQPTAIGYCQDTTGGVGALASFVTTSHNLAP